MPSVSVRYLGDHVLLSAIGPALTRDMARRARNVETRAKRLCPVDTGRLRSSITSRVEQRSGKPIGIIEADTNYAFFVEKGTRRTREKGTRRTREQPFLEPALEAAQK